MAENSKIEWTKHTQNLWWGCTKVHAGCDHCYAETLSHRWGKDVWGNNNPRRYISTWAKNLLRFQKLAQAAGTIDNVFVGSMMDIFEKPKPMVGNDGELLEVSTGQIRNEFFQMIDLGFFPNLMFLLLTKRPSNIQKYIPPGWLTDPPRNVMFGTSISAPENMGLVLQLLQVNGLRFLSIEPQLSYISLYPYLNVTVDARTGKAGSLIDWVIQGGESGPGKREFNLDWAYRLRNECKMYGVPYFFKQIDKVQPIPEDLMIREYAKTQTT